MLKMLIADDEPVIIRGLQMLIDWAQLGIEICATCENGADALREIFAQSPDLALLDISMPGKTGIEILKALHTAQSRTKVIFISGFQDFSYAHDALSYGAVDYLLKPVKRMTCCAPWKNACRCSRITAPRPRPPTRTATPMRLAGWPRWSRPAIF